MSAPTRYIEINSLYRNRVRYPHPSQFMVEISNSGSKMNAFSSYDPVFYSTPIYPPASSNEVSTNYVYPTVGYMYAPTLTVDPPTDPYSVAVIPVAASNDTNMELIPLSTLSNAYVGDILELVTKVGGTTTTNEYRTITDYSVEHTEIVNATVAANFTTTSVPLSGLSCNIDDFFIGWTVTFDNTTDPDLSGVSRVITEYRAVDRTVFFTDPIIPTITLGDTVLLSQPIYHIKIDTPFTVGVLPSLENNFTTSAYTTYRIRKNTPALQGTLVSGTSSGFVLPAAAGNIDYTGKMIWITSEPVILTDTVAASGVNTLTLTAAASGFANDYFNGMFVELTGGGFSGYRYLITDWNQGTLTLTVNVNWNAAGGAPGAAVPLRIVAQNPNNYHLITTYNTSTRTGTISPGFSYTLWNGSTVSYSVGTATFNILNFKRDNYYPLDYADSSVSQQQAVCYEIELISLVLPRVPVVSWYGGTILDYPYVYVEFKSMSQGTSAYDFPSNNPNARNAMFRAMMIYDIQEAKFITLDGHEMRQTLKFKWNDSFLFSVYLPNGELFLTDSDTSTPDEPNPLLQISACFGLRRL
jgi:hypothetical protein